MVRGILHLAAFGVALVTAAVICGSAQALPDCGARVLMDWRDGRIDQAYPVDCYREALAELPEDLRIYSSAESDITRALQARLRTTQPEADAATSSGPDRPVSPYLVAAVSLALALGAASVVALRH